MNNKERDYKTARTVAEQNLAKIVNRISPSLSKREEGIFAELSISNESSIKKLEKLYAFMDELYAFVGNFTPCRKGCSSCCRITVSISSLEAEYVQTNLVIRQTPNLDKKVFFGTPCPFLNDDACSIYEYRPFVCRRHHALFDNAKWCQLDLCQKYTFPLVKFTEIERSYWFIIGASHIYDIRQLFSSVGKHAPRS